MNIFNDNGEILPVQAVHSSLAHILETGTGIESNTAVGRILFGIHNYLLGSLTTLNRDIWADTRIELEDAGNGSSLRDIDGALFALCLDDLKTDNPQRYFLSLLIQINSCL